MRISAVVLTKYLIIHRNTKQSKKATKMKRVNATTTALRSLPRPWLICITLLLIGPYDLRPHLPAQPSSAAPCYYALGLQANASLITRSTRAPLSLPSSVRVGCRDKLRTLQMVAEASSTEDSTSSATAENTDATSKSMADTAAAAAAVSATATAEVSPRVNGSTHRTTTSSSRAAESSKNNIQSVAPRRKGIWTPPSQNAAQRRGSIFSIQQPQDLLDFVIEDERLSVGEFFMSSHICMTNQGLIQCCWFAVHRNYISSHVHTSSNDDIYRAIFLFSQGVCQLVQNMPSIRRALS